MTGNELKIKIKALDITQELAAEKLGVTRATLNNWCKQAELPIQIVNNVKTFLGIESDSSSSDSVLIETIRIQQKTIEDLTCIIKNLTSK